MRAPKITDNDRGEITATVPGMEIRGWSYKDETERRLKMQMAHEFAEGWFRAAWCGRYSRCIDLADAFLADHPHLATEKRTDELTALIEKTIEDWIAHEHSNYEPPDPPGFEGGFAANH